MGNELATLPKVPVALEWPPFRTSLWVLRGLSMPKSQPQLPVLQPPNLHLAQPEHRPVHPLQAFCDRLKSRSMSLALYIGI
jgi:hypothetical protein